MKAYAMTSNDVKADKPHAAPGGHGILRKGAAMKRHATGLLLVLSSWCGLASAETVQALSIHALGPGSFGDIKAQHAGKPFVVMLWSLDCAYCLESFHALEQARRKRKVEVVTIATDRADDLESASDIRKKLAAGGLRSQVWAFGNASAEQLRYSIDPKWRGELPRTYWFNAQGQSIAHSGALTAESVDKLLRAHEGAR
jgi:thiol-disulfide isomerase/thioredoxin